MHSWNENCLLQPLNRSKWTCILVTTRLPTKLFVSRSSAVCAAALASRPMCASCSMRSEASLKRPVLNLARCCYNYKPWFNILTSDQLVKEALHVLFIVCFILKKQVLAHFFRASTMFSVAILNLRVPSCRPSPHRYVCVTCRCCPLFVACLPYYPYHSELIVFGSSAEEVLWAWTRPPAASKIRTMHHCPREPSLPPGATGTRPAL